MSDVEDSYNHQLLNTKYELRKHSGTHPVTMHTLSQSPATPRPVSSCFSMTPTLSPLILELINKKKCYTVETQADDDCLRSKDQLLARISELTDRQSSLISYIQELTRLLEIAEDTPNKSTAKSVTSEPRDIATSQPINESLPALREIPKLSNRVTNSMMSSTPASAPMRMDNGTTLPSPPVSMQQYDTYSNALKTTCNSSHAAATEPCYAPPSLSIEEFSDFLDRLTEDAKQHYTVAIAEDFNSWAVDWDRKETNARGSALLDVIATLDVVLLNNGDTPTFIKGEEFIYPAVQCETKDIPPVTENELMAACDRIGNNKAPGLDGIPNITLKKTIKALLKLFLETYDSCPREGTFPRKWKQQRLVLLPKGKKPPDEPLSYRPLCMLDTVGKILERIIHKRVEKVVDQLLADKQHGFRKGRSALVAINLVVTTAKDAIAGTQWKRGTKKYCLVADLDFQNAFNSDIWDIIMRALEEKRVPGYLC
ncbi:uncharacterized protein LOC124368252 [Homalodisca vitripennis]|uniref:uncharacterized protein LOC124368252 n=1 Tax=Homalodisca vitripennis TaxID=197043 RepID=UPI001EEC023B|nr:uncharacterized protein LOC124368252 [Homalodisca vitripennis]